MMGIYKITNLINKKCYIGQSVHIERRFREHCNSNTNSYIHRAIQKYGKENFTFEVIEECSLNQLDEREKYWILFYNSLSPNGYNLVLETCNPSRNNTSIPVDAIIKDLQNTNLSLAAIGEKYDLHISIISRINAGQTHRQEKIVYPIREKQKKEKKTKEKRLHICEQCGQKISYTATRCNKCEGLHKRIPLEKMPVTREELKKLIRTTSFTQIGKQYQVSDNAIRKWCDKFNLPRKVSEIKKISDLDWENI